MKIFGAPRRARAGVEPNFTVFEGDEDQVRAFIADVNLERRDLKKGQKAMLLAILFPDAEKGGRGKKGKASETNGFSQVRLREARAVLGHSRALADEVIADRVPLDAALARVKDEQARASTTEAKTERLRAERKGRRAVGKAGEGRRRKDRHSTSGGDSPKS